VDEIDHKIVGDGGDVVEVIWRCILPRQVWVANLLCSRGVGIPGDVGMPQRLFVGTIPFEVM
jgi:hypothetical protein